MKYFLPGLRRYKAIGVVLCFLVFGSAKSQYVTIPDSSFVVYLQTFLPSCMVGNKLDTLCSALSSFSSIQCPNEDIKDLTGVQYFKGLTSLYVSGNLLTSIPPLANTVQTLQCQRNRLTVLPALPTGLGVLFCDGNNLTSLPVLPSGLTILSCTSNPLTGLPSLPFGLKTLQCYSCGLTVLPTLPSSITTLYCNLNALTALPTLPTSLVTFDCDDNTITQLPSIPAGVTTLYCANNQITGLPTLPAGLIDFRCFGNKIPSLPAILPPNLQFLQCSGNLLTSVPALPVSLLDFECGTNQLSTIPSLPPRLETFECRKTLATTIPALPDTLSVFWADSNNLVSLPALPASIRFLSCEGCQLTSLPALPDTLVWLNIANNPSLFCIPPFKILGSSFSNDLFSSGLLFYIKNTGIACLPNVIQHPQTPSVPSVDTLPICGLYNNSGCEVAWNIYGIITNDSIINCSALNTDPSLNAVKIDLSDNGQLLQSVYATNGTGGYSFQTGLGSYQVSVDTAGLPFDVSCPAGNLYNDDITLADSLIYDNNFGIVCKPGFDVGVLSIEAGDFWTAQTTTVNIGAGDISAFYGGHCADGVSGTVTADLYSLDQPAHYVSPAPGALTPTSSTPYVVTWDIPDFGALGFSNAFNIIVLSDSTIVGCPFVCLTVTVTPKEGDNNPSNNTFTNCFYLRSSQDPNYKEAYPYGYVDTADKWITYTIHFQNTGTAPAHNVHIIDTLDERLDPSSFQLVAFSYKPVTQVQGRIVQFNFPDINLPDSSTSKSNSTGYVQYKAKLKPDQPLGAVVANTAYILFDFNQPVVTNTTGNVITSDTFALSVSGLSGDLPGLRVFPNPASDKLILETTNFIPETILIYDINGRLLSEAGFTPQINIIALSSGIYFIEAKGSNAIIRQKFVKI